MTLERPYLAIMLPAAMQGSPVKSHERVVLSQIAKPSAPSRALRACVPKCAKAGLWRNGFAKGAPRGASRIYPGIRRLLGFVSGIRVKLAVDLPDVLTLALSSPSQSVMDVLSGEGLGDLGLAAVAVLAVPLWALHVADRPTVAALCENP